MKEKRNNIEDEEILSWEERKEIDILEVIKPGEIFYLRPFLQPYWVRMEYKGAYTSYDDELFLCFAGWNYVKSIKHSTIRCTYWHRTVECEDVISYDLGICELSWECRVLFIREFDPVAIKLFDIGFHRPITDFCEVKT